MQNCWFHFQTQIQYSDTLYLFGFQSSVHAQCVQACHRHVLQQQLGAWWSKSCKQNKVPHSQQQTHYHNSLYSLSIYIYIYIYIYMYILVLTCRLKSTACGNRDLSRRGLQQPDIYCSIWLEWKTCDSASHRSSWDWVKPSRWMVSGQKPGNHGKSVNKSNCIWKFKKLRQ